MIRLFLVVAILVCMSSCHNTHSRSPETLMESIRKSKVDIPSGTVGSRWTAETLSLVRELAQLEGYYFVFMVNLGFDAESLPFDILSVNPTWHYNAGAKGGDSLFGVFTPTEMLNIINKAMDRPSGTARPTIQFGQIDVILPPAGSGEAVNILTEELHDSGSP